MTLLLTGCATNGGFRLETEAAARKGAAEASIQIPALAAVCFRERPHAELRPGEELSSLAAREGNVVNALNKDKRDCRALENRWRQRAGR